MWILKKSADKEKKYLAIFWKYHPYYFTRKNKRRSIDSRLKETYVYTHIGKEEFEKFLIAKPNELLKLHDQLWGEIKRGGYDLAKEKEALESIFNYDSVIVNNVDFSYELAKLMDSNTCTYCNRLYTLTVEVEEDKAHDIKKQHLVRPQFDHWFAKSIYPEFALSFYNLIPSCSLCNSTLKHDVDMKLDTYIHPYVDVEAGFKFGFKFLNRDEKGEEHYAVTCNYTGTNQQFNDRVGNTLDLFKIQEIYDAHSELELRDLIELAQANPDDYIDTLLDNVMSETKLDRNQVIRLLFGVESNIDKYKDRPFSKFKMDIMDQLHVSLHKK